MSNTEATDSESAVEMRGYVPPVLKTTWYGRSVIEVTEWHTKQGFVDMVQLIAEAIKSGTKVIELRHK